MTTNRRNFLKAAGVGIAATTVPGLANSSVIPAKSKKNKFDFKLGIASYSLRNFPTEEALEMTQRCDINRISLKSMHMPLDSSKDEIRRIVALCKEKGITPYGAGVIYMKTKEDADQAFEYAKTAGIEIMIGVPNHELLDYVEGKVKDYDIKLAIHNHGPGDKLYPSAKSVYEKVKNGDKRMGLCIDIGHTKRIGRNPEEDLKDYFDRVFDMHIKDVTKAAPDGETCIIGRGVIDFPSFLEAVDKLDYKGTLALEYEAEEKDPLPGMMASLGYVRGIMAMM